MDPIRAIDERIEELRLELDNLKEAKQLLRRTQPRERTYRVAKSYEGLDEQVLEFFRNNKRDAGFLISEITNGINAESSDAVRDCVHVLERKKILHQTNNTRRFRRYAFVEAKPVSEIELKPTRRRKRKSVKPGSRSKAIKKYLKSHNIVTVRTIKSDLGWEKPVAGSALKQAVKNGWAEKVGLETKTGPGRPPMQYRSKLRETVVTPGDGIREGRLVAPRYPDELDIG